MSNHFDAHFDAKRRPMT